MRTSLTRLSTIAALLLPNLLWAAAPSLPGGILYPPFAVAAVVNPAALPIEWAFVAEGMYFPPLSEQEAHNYLGSVAMSNHHVAFNAGYTGSTYGGTSLHSAFMGAGYRRKRFSFGLGLNSTNLTAGFNPALSLGWIVSLKGFRFGMVGYDLGSTSNASAGIGLGFGPSGRYNIEVNLLTPHIRSGFRWGSEHVLVGSVSRYFRKIGFSVGGRYSKYFADDGTLRTTSSFTIGAMYRIRTSFIIIAQYTNAPQSFGIGLVLGKYPSEESKRGEYMDDRLGNLQKK